MKLTPEQIQEYQDWVNKDNGERPLYKCDVDRLIAHIAQLEAENAELREAERWIPVETPPEEYCEDGILYNYQNMLVRCENGAITEAMWCGDCFKKPEMYSYKLFEFETNPVTHWRPLPKYQPPEAKGE